MKKVASKILYSIDPRRDVSAEAPRAFIMARNMVEWLFKVAGYFLVLCLTLGITLAACSDSFLLNIIPFLLAFALFFYIALTTIGMPVFLLIGEIENSVVRRVASWVSVLLLLTLTLYWLETSPLYEAMKTYVSRLFPEALTCESGISPFE